MQRKISDLILDSKRRMEVLSHTKTINGVSTGIDKLDNLTGGLQNGQLITIAARPSMGKTSFALTVAGHLILKRKIPFLFFSLETTTAHIVNKLISAETGIALERLRSAKLERNEWVVFNDFSENLKKSQFFIDDTLEISIDQIETEVDRFVSEKEVEVVFIDYLQLITISNLGSFYNNRQQEISAIVKRLKTLARNHDIPIVLLSQLDRSVDKRYGSKRPILLDFGDSQSIEEDSDFVGFIFRPEYYKMDEWDDEERLPTNGQAELIVAKHRNGRLENIRLKFSEQRGRFYNLDDFDSPFEFQSKMNADEENPFLTKNLPDANQALGSSMNDTLDPEDDNDVPF